MSIIQQPTLFDIDFLTQLDCPNRYAELFSPIDFYPILTLFQKEKQVGPPIEINYKASVCALVARFIEGIPSIKALVKRLKEDLQFKLSLGFLYSDRVPSQATFSRITQTLAKHPEVLETLNRLLLQKIDASFNIFNETIAIDATAIKAHSKPTKTENPKLPSVENQRMLSKKERNTVIPHYPSWGVKKNSQGKNNYWFGYKGHYAVTTKTHYLVSAVTTSAFVSDVSIAIPLLRNLSDMNIQRTFVLMDKGYDAKAVYEEAHACTFEPIIDLKKSKKSNGEVDRYFTPTCLLEHSYSYDSFDFRYGALKFVRPEQHCRGCPLKNEGLCQKVMKIKQTTNVRNYSHPARGTKSWRKIYAERTAVERVNSYLKRSYQLNDTTYYKAEQVVAEQLLIQLTYNLKTYANQRLNKKHREKELVA